MTSEEEVRTVLVEIVQRFCDKETNEARKLCNDSDKVIDNMMVKITKVITNGEGEVEVDAPEATAPSRRRLLAAATNDLVGNACQDPEAADSFTFSSDNANPDAPTAAKPTTSAASSTFVTIAAFLPVLALFN